MFTSKTTRSFYDETIHTDIPPDAVEITKEEHQALFEGQSQGFIIDWDEDGYAFLKEPAPLTVEELDAAVLANRQAAYTAEADPLFYEFQRKEITKQVWLDKIAEIKLRYPKTVEVPILDIPDEEVTE